jgi:hypothetical protein
MRKLTGLASWTMLLAAGGVAPRAEVPPTPPPDAPADARHAGADRSHDFIRLAFNFYSQHDGGGNPYVDENNQVIEPSFLLSKSLGEGLTMTVKLQGDWITNPLGTSASNSPVKTTASSGKQYVRGDAGLFYAWSDSLTLGAGLSASTEPNYRSVGTYVKGTWETPSKNDSLGLRLGAYFDTVSLNYWDGTSGGEDVRRSFAISPAWTHVLGPGTLMTLNYDLTLQTGYLASPSNFVYVLGTAVPELLPRTRQRHALSGRVRHLLTDDLAIEPGLGVYLDDWGATAWSASLALFWEAIPDGMIVRPHARFHDQTAVDAFVPYAGATGIPKFRTQDSDLAAFTDTTVGLKLIWPHALGESVELELGGEYTDRSDGISWWSVSTGLQWRF